jgi:CRP-like cAMP-binding protein
MIASGLFKDIAPGDIKKLRIAMGLSPQNMNVGDVLVDEGGFTDVFWILISGSLQGARCYPDGSADLVEVYSPGDAVCLDVVFTRTRKSLLQISCVDPAEVVAASYDSLMKSSVRTSFKNIVTGNILRILANDSMRKQYKIDVLYKRSLRERIITFFVHMSEKAGDSRFDISMDREQLSGYLGVNRSALSHELSLMRRDGLIDFSRSRFELLPDFHSIVRSTGNIRRG